MLTPYQNVYDRFLSKITDYELSELAASSATVFESTLLKYLKSAIVDFNYCSQDLSDRDDVAGQFNIDLTEMEEEILANYMLSAWIKPHILRLENIRQNLGNKDFTLYSGANMLEKLLRVKKELRDDADRLSVDYYYSTV